MNVRFKTPDGDGPFLTRSLEVEGVQRVVRGSINFDYSEDTIITAKLEVNLGSVDIKADTTMFTIIEGVQYRLVEEPKLKD